MNSSHENKTQKTENPVQNNNLKKFYFKWKCMKAKHVYFR